MVVTVTYRNIALHFVTMKKKVETCLYCGEKISPKTTRMKFCSSKCRVYWNRELKTAQLPIQDQKEIPSEESSPKTSDWKQQLIQLRQNKQK